MIKLNGTENKTVLKRRRLLYILVTSLVFEGLIRKLAPAFLGLPIFFFKDVLCIIALFSIAKENLKGNTLKVSKYWKIVFFAFIPLLITTAYLDPILAPFALKQYLLYVVVAILVPLSFPPDQEEAFTRFVSFFTLMLIPTALIAVLQNALPASSWLNLSVDGSSLDAFSADGYLRVSSTFSFNAQYVYFLNAVTSFLGARLFLNPIYKTKFFNFFKKYSVPIMAMSLIIGSFITGSRSAVYGCVLCLFIGIIFLGIKSPKLILGRGVVAMVFLLISLTVLQTLKPEFFAAFNKRTENTSDYSSNEELAGRVEGNFFNWTDWIFDVDLKETILGRGLAVMSNGSDKFSSYAYSIRPQHIWTETDMATTVWEGGIYLLILWYGFRIAVMVFCYRIWKSLKEKKFAFAVSFLMGFLIVMGLNGTLSIQPPLAIWWWMCIGSIIAIKGFDNRKNLTSFSQQVSNSTNVPQIL